VYDYCWYPQMSSNNPSLCCFASTSRDHPVHLWDAFTGQIRCSYRTYDQVDEITPAISISFNLTGDKIYCGYQNYLKIFDVGSPGRDSTHVVVYNKRDGGQRGLLSCINFSPDYSGMFAVGSYSNTVGIYSESDNSAICFLEDKEDGSGITHVQFSPNGNYLMSGSRKSSSICCWDIRNTGKILYRLPRKASTNQRIYFDIESTGSFLVTGSQDNKIIVYDLNKPVEPIITLQSFQDAVNGVSFHPNMPYLASSSGQRQFILKDDEDSIKEANFDSRLLVWKINQNKEKLNI